MEGVSKLENLKDFNLYLGNNNIGNSGMQYIGAYLVKI